MIEPAGRSAATSPKPRVGVVYSWIDPHDPQVWSSIPTNLIAALKRIGMFGGAFDTTPPRRALRISTNLRSRIRRNRQVLALAPEIRALARLSDVVSRRRSPHLDGWIALSYAFGSIRPVRDPMAVFTDISPRQVREMHRLVPESALFSQMTEKDVKVHMGQLVKTFRAAHACCVASRWAADSLVDDHGIDPARVHVVGLGHTVSPQPTLGRDWSSPRFIFIGRDWERKNGPAVVRAFARIRADYPSARLHIVGKHPRISLEGVVGHGEIPGHEAGQRQQLDQLLVQSTCFVLPSRFEPFGIVYLEAASFGLPSIGTSVGGARDAIGPGGILVDPTDDDSIVGALRRMCDPKVASELGAVAQRHSANFTWDKVAARLVLALGLQVGEELNASLTR